MLSSLALFMATIVSHPTVPPGGEGRSNFRPVAGATATATVSIRVISGVRFGADHIDGDALGSRRKAQLTDAAGQPRDAELLEFQ
jgi:hypothetical protein